MLEHFSDQAQIKEPNTWHLRASQLVKLEVDALAAMFYVGNGFVGVRGVDELTATQQSLNRGTYMNGVYVREPIKYGESAYGYASHNHKIAQLPDGTGVTFQCNSEVFLPQKSGEQKKTKQRNDALTHDFFLNLADATLNGSQILQTASGKHLLVKWQRFASQSNAGLILTRFELEALNFSDEIILSFQLSMPAKAKAESDDPRQGESIDEQSLRCVAQESSACFSYQLVEISDPKTIVCCGLSIESEEEIGMLCQPQKQLGNLSLSYSVELHQNNRIKIDRYLNYQKSVLQDSHSCRTREELKDRCERLLTEYIAKGWSNLIGEQKNVIHQFWNTADIEIKGSESDQVAIRANQLLLFMSVSDDVNTSVSAKGLSAAGYDGHYFWDSEIYVLPMFAFTQPKLAKSLLSFRYSTLSQALVRAKQMAIEKGALFPWRTIGGEECSAYYPAGTAQYHINAAIAYAIKVYLKATDDWQFMLEKGAELLWQTARVWPEIGHFNRHNQGLFCIDLVTGPDEYTALVNNNFYTNSMAKFHLQFAIDLCEKLKAYDCVEYEKILQKIGLTNSEIKQWQTIADKMYIPFDESRAINPQDDTFLAKKKWDLEKTPKNKFPLLLHFHPLVLYRHQVIKQADVVLAMNLVGEQVNEQIKSNNLAYYEPLTTHDSTLSACAYCIAHADLKNSDKAFEYFQKTLYTDLKNLHQNTHYGIHTANLGGSWLCIVRGFAGFDLTQEKTIFKPKVPKHYQSIKFRVVIKESQLEVELSQRRARYLLLSGPAMVILHYDQEIELSASKPQQLIEVLL